MKLNPLFATLLLSIAALSATSLMADDVVLPKADESAPPAAAPIKLPPRGSTMSTVEAAFGAPINREEAVGTPPITRWEYSQFVVYFENDRVIHSVVK
jgi:hypothetical protein